MNHLNGVEENNIILGIAVKLAAALGPEWRHYSRGEDYFPRSHYVTAGGDIHLHVHLRWNDKDRVELGGSYGENNSLSSYKPYNEQIPEITVARSRSAEDMAKEVRRRLLPEYEALMVKTRERYAQHLAYEARINANRDAMVKALKGREYDGRTGKTVENHELHIEAKIGADAIDLEIGGLTAEDATRIIQWVKSWRVGAEDELEAARR